MKFKTPSGRYKDISVKKYLIDFDGEQGSKFSEDVLDFLYPYWKYDIVLCECPVAGTRLRYDYVNLSKKIICETDGAFHDQFSEYFYNGSRNAYLNQIKRDLLKDKMAKENGFLMIRIKPSDMPLTKNFFKYQFGIDL